MFDNLASDVSGFITSVLAFFSLLLSICSSYIDFALELFGIPADVFNACCLFLLVKLTVPVLAFVVKLVLRWYQSLMPTK